MNDTPADASSPEDEFAPILHHASFLRRLAQQLVTSESEAEDLEQATWLTAIEKPPRERHSLRGWLATVLRNVSRENHRRGQRRRRREQHAARTVRHDDDSGRELVLHEVTEAVLALEPAAREVVFLRYYEDLSTREIAIRLDLPIETVRTRLKRAHARLRQRLDGAFGADRRAWMVPLVELFDPPQARTLAESLIQTSSVAHSTSPSWATAGGLLMHTPLKVIATITVALVATVFWLEPWSSTSIAKLPVGTESAPPQDSEEMSDDLAENDTNRPDDRNDSGSFTIVEGYVRHAITGEPLGGIRVANLNGGRSRGEVRTESDGSFRLESRDFQPGDSVLVSGSGFVPVRIRLEPSVDATRHVPPIYLSPGIRVTGEIVREDGAPVRSGVGYALEGVTTNASPFDSSSAVHSAVDTIPLLVDADGHFEFTTNARRVAFVARGHDSGPAYSEVITPDAKSVEHVVIRVRPGHTLNGRVVDSRGRPVGGATISCSPINEDRHPDHLFMSTPLRYSTTSGEDGSFTIRHLTRRIAGWSANHPAHPSRFERNVHRSTADFLSIELEPSARLRVRFIGSTSPLSVADVEIAGHGSATVFADDDDSFRVLGLPSAVRFVGIQVRGYMPVRVSVPRSTPLESDGEIELPPIQLTKLEPLEVVVVDGRRNPIAGARVSVRTIEPETTICRTTSDAEGRAGLFRPEEPVRIEVYHPEYGAMSLLQPLAATHSEVELKKGRTVSGRIIEEKTQAPIPGASIELELDSHEGNHRGTPFVTTTSSGEFVLRGVPDRWFALRISHPEHVGAMVEPGGALTGRFLDLGSIALGRGASISGTVRDRRGAPIPGAIVSAERAPGETVFTAVDRRPWVTTDREGRYSISGLPPGSVTLTARCPGFRPRSNEATAGRDASAIDFTLDRRSNVDLTGVVVDEDTAPVPFARVEVIGRETPDASPTFHEVQTALDGSFLIDGAPAIVSRVSVSASGYVDLELTNGDLRPWPERFTLTRGATLEVVVSVDSGPDLPKFVRYHLDTPGHPRSHLVPLVEGRAFISGLSGGKTTLKISAAGFPTTEPQSIALTEGRTERVEVRLGAEAMGFVVRVRNHRGQPIGGAYVTLFDSQGDVLATVRSDNLGLARSSEFVNRPATTGGSARLEVFARGYARSQQRGIPRPSNGMLDVDLGPESVLNLDVLDPSGPLSDVEVVLVPAAGRLGGEEQHTSDEAGRVTISGLGDGRYRLLVRRGLELLHESTIVISAGAERSETISVASPIVVTGVLRHNGAPVTTGSVQIVEPARAVGNTASLDANGGFQVTVRARGKVRVIYRPENGDPQVTSLELLPTYEPAGCRVELDWRADGLSVGKIEPTRQTDD